MDGHNQAPTFLKRGVQTQVVQVWGRDDSYRDAIHELQEASRRGCWLNPRMTLDSPGGDSCPFV
jgi:hypothetical protein